MFHDISFSATWIEFDLLTHEEYFLSVEAEDKHLKSNGESWTETVVKRGSATGVA